MSQIRKEFILETGQAQSNLSQLLELQQKFNESLGKSGQESRKAFKESADATATFNRQLAHGVQIQFKAATAAQKVTNEIDRLSPAFKEASKAQKKFTSEADYEGLQKDIGKVKGRIGELKNEIESADKKTSGLSGTFKRVFSGMAAYFTFDTLVDFGKQIFNVTSEFQKFEAVLTNSLGSKSAAQQAMLTIQDFAAKTPFSVAELTDAYVKLANRGIRPTLQELTALGDLASSSGKSFDQLTEAALDAMTGENERLKEFGIQASKVGDKTFFTFKGVTTEVKNTDEAIRNYLVSLGQVEGVTGSMAAISETLTGQVSNLGDSMDQFFLTIGQSNSGVMSGFVSFLNQSLQAVTNLVASTDQLGKNLAAGKVNKFAEEIKNQFSALATDAAKNGEDVAHVLAAQGELLQKDLETKLKTAEESLAKFREERSKAAEVLDLSGKTYLFNKAAEASLSSSVQQYKGQLDAIKDVQNEILKPKGKGVDANAAKAAAEAAKKAAEARKRALADLENELARLEKEAARARLDLLEKNSREYQIELLAQRTKEIDIIEDTIKKKEKAAGKDGIIDPKQAAQLALLREAALKEYNQNIYNLELAERKKLLDLQRDSDAKELEQINLRYEAEIEAAHRAKDRVLAAELEKAKQRELAVTKFRQANNNVDAEETLTVETALLFKVDNTQTDTVKLERDKQQAILDVQIEFAQKRMNLLETETGAEATTRRFALANQINELRLAKAKIEEEQRTADFDLLALLGVDENDRDKVKEGFNLVAGYAAEFAARSLEVANELLAFRTKEIEERKAALETEIDLNKQGFASDVATKRAQLEEAKKQRTEALKEQQKALRIQQAMDAVSQLSSLITAGTTIFEATAALNIVPGLGIAIAVGLIGAMMGAMASLKGKASAATKFEKGGVLGGKPHSQGGNKFVSMDGQLIEHEEGEFFTNRKSTNKYYDWLMAINEDNPSKLAQLSFNYMLPQVVPARELANEVHHKSETYKREEKRQDNGLLRRLESMEAELKKVTRNTGDRDGVIETDDYTLYKTGNTTRKVWKK